MVATSAMLSNDNTFGQFVAERNSTLAMQQFMQGTLENMLLATVGMWVGSRKGESFGNKLRAQN
jgi:small basic protein